MNSNSSKVVRLFLFVLIFFFVFFLFQFCDESINTPDDQSFSFKVKVIDSNKNPISNLKIGVCFQFTNQFMEKDLLKTANLNYGNTKFLFSIKSVCKITLAAYDLENKEVEQIIHDEKINAGNWAVIFVTGDLFPGVYKCVLEAKDTLNNNTLYRDSVYAVLWHTDPAYNGIGFTDNEGTFETRNKLYFPSLYNLPELIRTLEDGPDQVGTFGIKDSITILVTHDYGGITWTQIYGRKLTKNINNYELVFQGLENNENLIENRIGVVNENKSKFNGPVISKPSVISSVGLEYFTATPNSNDVYLDWKTQWETNNTGFEIQRKSNSPAFDVIGFVQGHGTTNQQNIYSFIDRTLYIGNYLYRLRIIEFDGSFEYSDTAEVSLILPTEFSLSQNYPNPFN